MAVHKLLNIKHGLKLFQVHERVKENPTLQVLPHKSSKRVVRLKMHRLPNQNHPTIKTMPQVHAANKNHRKKPMRFVSITDTAAKIQVLVVPEVHV